MSGPIELVRRDDPTGLALLYACASCGTVYTPHSTRDDDGHDHARLAAAGCRACMPHDQARNEADQSAEGRRTAQIAAARHVTDLGFCFSDRNGRCYPSVQEAAESGETGVFGSLFHPFAIDAGSMVSAILEEHHEGCSEDDLEGLSELHEAIDAFNATQTKGSYSMDDKRWQGIGQTETFAMIKPDATARGVEDAMIADIEAAGFRVKQAERRVLRREEAEFLYDEHRRRDHFNDLVDYTISGDVVLLRLEGDDQNTPGAFRKLMGATDRTKADPGTLRERYAVGYRENSVHGSDSPDAAVNELAYFFK